MGTVSIRIDACGQTTHDWKDAGAVAGTNRIAIHNGGGKRGQGLGSLFPRSKVQEVGGGREDNERMYRQIGSKHRCVFEYRDVFGQYTA
jgi:hypothetical protein